ncbi:unnamed protein product [Durusdinium trenchii]|uniref:Uncharacterized protein n=1 Tax=Durusdinium trenchii TaxID=1381693 RepID=A0ABP0M6I6_9DINO
MAIVMRAVAAVLLLAAALEPAQAVRLGREDIAALSASSVAAECACGQVPDASGGCKTVNCGSGQAAVLGATNAEDACVALPSKSGHFVSLEPVGHLCVRPCAGCGSYQPKQNASTCEVASESDCKLLGVGNRAPIFAFEATSVNEACGEVPEDHVFIGEDCVIAGCTTGTVVHLSCEIAVRDAYKRTIGLDGVVAKNEECAEGQVDITPQQWKDVQELWTGFGRLGMLDTSKPCDAPFSDAAKQCGCGRTRSPTLEPTAQTTTGDTTTGEDRGSTGKVEEKTPAPSKAGACYSSSVVLACSMILMLQF